MDRKIQKEKLLEKAQELRKKALEAKGKVDSYAKRGRKQRIIVMVSVGAVLLLFCYVFFSRAITSTEQEYERFICNADKTDCRKYEGVLRLWRPYRDKPYNVPGDE